MDRAAFAEDVVVADVQVGRFALDDRMVLGRLAERRERVDHVVPPERRMPVDVAVTDQARTGADPDVRTDKAERTDFDAVVELGAVGNDGGGMNFRHTQDLTFQGLMIDMMFI